MLAFRRVKRPLIIAHRGSPGRSKENTLAGFRAGLAAGADGVELDLRQTADGALVCYHDAWLGSRRVEQCTLAEARARARRLRRLQLPTLEEVLESLPRAASLNVEIKTPGIGREVLARLARHDAAERCVISSFDLPTVRALARVPRRVPTGLIATKVPPHPVGTLRRAGAQALCLYYRRVDATLVEALHRAGLKLVAWTVNHPRDLGRLLAFDVDAIITDYPHRLARLLEGTRTAGASRGAVVARTEE